MLLGAACWGLLADELGRKKALVAATGVVVAAGLTSSAAPTLVVSAGFAEVAGPDMLALNRITATRDPHPQLLMP
jgi:MFS family permease